MNQALRDILAVLAWSAFWVLVVAGIIALAWEWHVIGPAIGL